MVSVENAVGCTTNAIASVNIPGQFKIYPNPVSDELTIMADNSVYKNMVITNNIGQTLIQQPLTATTTGLNIHGLPSGLYYIRLTQENGNYKVQKFVKM